MPGSVWRTPSHRDPEKPQIEFCDLCGTPQAAEDLIEATAEGLRGYRVCKDHAELALNPSYQDLGGPGNAFPAKREMLPHSGGNGLLDDSEWP